MPTRDAARKPETARVGVAWGVKEEVTAAQSREQDAARRTEAVLGAVGFAAERLLRADSWEDEAQEVLAKLGEATEVSRAYIIQNLRGEGGTLLARATHEWRRPGIARTVTQALRDGYPWEAGGFGRWVAVLGKREPVHGPVATFPRSERKRLATIDVRSLAGVPVFAGEDWWGVIGLDDCETEREWSGAELAALTAAADTLGAAIERQRSNEQLQRDQADLRALLAGVPDLMIRLNRAGDYLDLHANDSSLLAAPREAAVGQNMRDLLPPEFVEVAMRTLGEALDSGEARVFEAPLAVPAGVRDFECRVEPVGSDEVIVIVRDISETRATQRALRESEERYRRIVQTATEGICTFDAGGVITFANRPLARLLGFEEPEQVIGQPAMAFADESWRELGERMRERRIAGDSDQYDFLVRRPDGSGRWVMISATPIIDEQGEFGGTLAMVTDISERKRVEEALRRSHAELEALYRLAGFAARADNLEQLCEAALDGLQQGIGADRTAVLLFDGEGAPRVVDSRGLSEGCQRIVEANSPWSAEEADAKPFLVPDVEGTDGLAELREAALREGVGALGFIPLVHAGHLLGQCVVCYDAPHPFAEDEVRVAEAVAGHTALEVARMHAERETLQAEARFRTLAEQIPAAVYLDYFDVGSTPIYISPRIEELTGYAPHLWMDPSFWLQVIHPEDRERVHQLWLRCHRDETRFRTEYRLITADGRLIWLREEDTILRDAEGRPRYTQGFMVDITEAKQSEERLRESEERYRRIVETANEGVLVLDTEGTITLANPTIAELLGYGIEEMVGRPVFEFMGPTDAADARDSMRTRRDRVPERLERRLVRRDGGEVWALVSASPINDADGRWAGSFAMLTDITERKRNEDWIAYLAYHDELTGLPNRAMFQEHLAIARARAERHERAVAVLYMDLDRFKLVNDSLGHAAGDEALAEVAARLGRVTRAEDLLARHSGDEFLLMLADLNPPEAREAAEAAAIKVHDALRKPFVTRGEAFSIDASIGIGMFPEQAPDGEVLLRLADTAMYQSKREGGGGTRVFEQSDDDALTELSVTNRLRHALEEKQFELHFQPVVALETGERVGLEALIRWQDPERGLVAAADFVPLAEEIGLIEPLGEWVIGEFCQRAQELRRQGIELDMAFNVSLQQLRRADFASRLLGSIREAGIEPSTIVVEITESEAMAHPDATKRALNQLSEAGVKLAIDDFGTGHSSLSRVLSMRMPFQILKIDRSFLAQIPGDPVAETVVAGMVQVTKRLGMRPLAEGIESEGQRKFLAEHGCELGQGNHFSPALPLEQLTAKA